MQILCTIATQLAKKVAQLGTVITTAYRPESKKWCEQMGADFNLDHTRPLLPQLQKQGLQNVDYILCCSYTDYYFDQMVELIKPQGSICTIAETRGNTPLGISKLQAKSINFCWGLCLLSPCMVLMTFIRST